MINFKRPKVNVYKTVEGYLIDADVFFSKEKGDQYFSLKLAKQGQNKVVENFKVLISPKFDKNPKITKELLNADLSAHNYWVKVKGKYSISKYTSKEGVEYESHSILWPSEISFEKLPFEVVEGEKSE